jgi:hypothetical protein
MSSFVTATTVSASLRSARGTAPAHPLGKVEVGPCS